MTSGKKKGKNASEGEIDGHASPRPPGRGFSPGEPGRALGMGGESPGSAPRGAPPGFRAGGGGPILVEIRGEGKRGGGCAMRSHSAVPGSFEGEGPQLSPLPASARLTVLGARASRPRGVADLRTGWEGGSGRSLALGRK